MYTGKKIKRKRRVIDIIPATFDNVVFLLFLERESDRRKCECLGERIKVGETLTLRLIHQWCGLHKLRYETKFIYRKDFSVMKNVKNAFWFIRSKAEHWDRIYQKG